jgi:hypothetical protein
MNLIELEVPINIDPGGTMPEINADELSLSVSFYLLDGNNERGQLNFNSVSQFTFGYPNEEAINGHRYFSLGLLPFMFVEVIGSEVIQGIIELNRVHPYHKDEMFSRHRHFVFPFHDSTLEVIAQSYNFEKVNQKS